MTKSTTEAAPKMQSKRSRKAVGPDRQTYFNEGDIDKVMAALLALASEVASIRDRLDTHERIAANGAAPSIDLVEAYRPDEAAEQSREAWRDAYIRRIFRLMTEDLESLQAETKENPPAST